MRTLLYLTLALLSLGSANSWAKNSSVRLEYLKIGSFRTFVVTVNLNDSEVKVTPVLSQGGIGTAEKFRSIIHRSMPTAAITGTFFSLDNRLPTGDIVRDGQFVYFGGIGHAIAITPENQAYIIPRPVNRHVDWTGYDTVLCAGPRLIWSGIVGVNPRYEGFRDRHMIYSRTMRMGIGITRYNKLLMVAIKTPCYLSQLAKVMRRLGCWDAVSVDAGSSSALYYRGGVYARPGRWLTNLLAVYDHRGKSNYSRSITQR